MKKLSVPGIRLGCTSFVLPADYIEGMKYACSLCSDVTLLLTEPEALPSRDVMRTIAEIAADSETRVSLHLPDISLFPGISEENRIAAVLKTIEKADPIPFRECVLHIESDCSARGFPLGGRAVSRLERIADVIESHLPERAELFLENVENHPPESWDRISCRKCIDIGHLWKDGHDAAGFLEKRLAQTGVIHLHGYDAKTGRDHVSLGCMRQRDIDQIVFPLWDKGYEGLLTLEMFGPDKFRESWEILMQSRRNYEKTCISRK